MAKAASYIALLGFIYWSYTDCTEVSAPLSALAQEPEAMAVATIAAPAIVAAVPLAYVLAIAFAGLKASVLGCAVLALSLLGHRPCAYWVVREEPITREEWDELVSARPEVESLAGWYGVVPSPLPEPHHTQPGIRLYPASREASKLASELAKILGGYVQVR